MLNIKHLSGYTLLESLIAALLSLVICSCTLHYTSILLQTYVKLSQKFKLQHSKLVARHYIRYDLQHFALSVDFCSTQNGACDRLGARSIQQQIASKQIKPLSDLLIIHGIAGDIVYYMRKSVVPSADKVPTYALYRDDIVHNAQALVEDLDNFTVEIRDLDLKTYEVIAHVLLKKSSPFAIKTVRAKHAG